MKTLIISLLCALPCLAFSQAMQLPGAADLSKPAKSKTANPKTKNVQPLVEGTAASGDTSNIGLGTAIAPKRYNASVLSTNFTVPLVRVNFLNNKASGSNALVSTSFLNSAGAGLTYAWGEVDQTFDKTNAVASTTFTNHFGFQLGFLFAANTASGSSSTTTSSTTTTSTQSSAIFAIMAGVSILNIQVGGGYEFGTLSTGQKRGFMTIAYAIPLSSLIGGGYKIFHPVAISGNTP